jgi:hypothetical protein
MAMNSVDLVRMGFAVQRARRHDAHTETRAPGNAAPVCRSAAQTARQIVLEQVKRSANCTEDRDGPSWKWAQRD